MSLPPNDPPASSDAPLVPPSWWRDEPPRSRYGLIVAHLDALTDRTGYALLGLIEDAFNDIERLLDPRVPGDRARAEVREAFLAALLAELVRRNGNRLI